MKTLSTLGIGLTFLGLTCGFPGRSIAQQGPLVEIREALEKLDTNGDMTIDRDEVPESGRAAFDRLLDRVDKNKNKKMEIEERRELFLKLRVLADPAAAAQRFKTIDADSDGKLTRAEFPGEDAQFARLDGDKDGKVTLEEFVKAQSAPPPTAVPPLDATRRLQRILAMDKNGDGKITRAEWQGMPQVFERLDTDKDGSLSRSELPKAPPA